MTHRMTRLLLGLVVLAGCAGGEGAGTLVDTREAQAEAASEAVGPDDGTVDDARSAESLDEAEATEATEASLPPDAVGPEACPGADEPAGRLVVAPYLQWAEPHAVTIRWSTDTGTESRVEWGRTDAPGQRACGRVETTVLGPPEVLHHVRLTDLEAGTAYTYRVHTGEVASDGYTFFTPPDPGAERSFRFVSMSDMQRDDAYPDKFREIIHEGVLAYVTAHFGPALHEELAFASLPGDLVDSGWLYHEWVDDFFAPIAELAAQVPLYPVYGNHEGGSPVYRHYFDLPPNGMEIYEEHWYWLDYGNVRLLGLDSNEFYRKPEQLDWLQGVLDETCGVETIDFVFAQLHHPHHSELWPEGNADFTGDVSARLEQFATACGKPTAILYGHTHAYSRGQSRDHAHLMVNVASAGGAIDRWGSPTQQNYDEFSISTDDYGFVVVEVEAGDTPSFRISRVSRGNPEAPLDNVLRDSVTIRKRDTPPSTPTAVAPVDAGEVCDEPLTLRGSAYQEGEGDRHWASHWQVAAACDFAAPAVDAWRQAEDWYQGVDLRADADLETFDVDASLTPGTYCWRVRYRDESLAWSDWSEPTGIAIATLPGR